MRFFLKITRNDPKRNSVELERTNVRTLFSERKLLKNQQGKNDKKAKKKKIRIEKGLDN